MWNQRCANTHLSVLFLSRGPWFLRIFPRCQGSYMNNHQGYSSDYHPPGETSVPVCNTPMEGDTSASPVTRQLTTWPAAGSFRARSVMTDESRLLMKQAQRCVHTFLYGRLPITLCTRWLQMDVFLYAALAATLVLPT